MDTSTPERERLDPQILAKADDAIRKTMPTVLSFMVVRHDLIVYEKYYHGNNPDSLVVVYSVTKSVISALTGIAIRDRHLPSVDKKLTDIFPQYFTDNSDPRKREITVKHLLTMTAGLEVADDEAWLKSADGCKYVIDRPLAYNPGQKFGYNNGLTNLLSVILTKTTGMTTKEFADNHLFGPLGISNYTWARGPQGYYIGGWGLRLTPRDIAKFGYLYLREGMHDGQQLVPRQWVQESVASHSYPEKTDSYGYAWWLDKLEDRIHGKKYQAFLALGYGGQFIWVVPELDIVTVITVKEESPEDRPEYSDVWHLIHNYVLPAVG